MGAGYKYCPNCGAKMDEALSWRSVENELPEFDEDVLVYAIGKSNNFIGDGVIAITSYTNNKYGFNIVGWNDPWQYFLTNYEITHWMPLPEPPKEVEP